MIGQEESMTLVRVKFDFRNIVDRNLLLPISQSGDVEQGTPPEVRDSNSPIGRARQTIRDLKEGEVPQSIVRDLGEAVREATRNHELSKALRK